MKARRSNRMPAVRIPATAALTYWLLVVCGAFASTIVRPSDVDQIVPLWAGAFLGTALGQLLARGRLRPWLVALVMTNMMWFGFILIAPFGWAPGVGDTWGGVELGVMTFLPAIVCGYASLTERGGLVAFWFPAALFMLPILEHPEGTDLEGSQNPRFLLAVLAALFVAFLRARETRRVALWQGSGAVRLSLQRPALVLRQSPLRSLAQWGSLAATGAVAIALTAWMAPLLWQKEKLATHHVTAPPMADIRGNVSVQAPGGAPGVGADWTALPVTQASCCPEATEVVVERDRFKEYFPLHAHEAPVPVSQPKACVICGHNVASTPVAFAAPNVASTWTAGAPPSQMAPSAPLAPGAPTPSVAAPTANSSAAAASHTTGASPTTSYSSAAPPHFAAREPAAIAAGTGEEDHPLGWLVTFAACVFGLELALRPMRRLLTLRHLRSPLWGETVDQRVSNLWQLALVGLRDAGFCATPGEQPEELAHRVGVPGMESCATVLERARHGVRVDAADLELMTREASSVYQTARKGVRWPARAASWLRWPLV